MGSSVLPNSPAATHVTHGLKSSPTGAKKMVSGGKHFGRTFASDRPKTSKAVSPKAGGGSNASKKKAKRTGFSTYIYRVLKDIYPDTNITNKAMDIMNSFVMDTFERVATEASLLCKRANKDTISVREIECSVKLVVPGELGLHSIQDGQRAVSTFQRQAGKGGPET